MDLRFIKYTFLMLTLIFILYPLDSTREYLFGRLNPSKSDARADRLIRKGDLYLYLSETHLARFSRKHP